MAAALETPVLVIIYKRAETTRKVLEALAKVKPKRIFVSANAPNPSNSADPAKVQEVRDLFDNLPWECEVTKLFRTEHLSAKLSISGGISWFFSQVEEGIVLEDDCECDPSFFYYAQELLEKYRDHPQVMHIGASNFQFGQKRGDASYYFSRYNHIWAWAGWRTTWQNFKLTPAELNKQKVYTAIDKLFVRESDRGFWKAMFNYAMSGRIDTWDYQYMFSLWAAGGIAITPQANLISNLGFGADATNSISANSRVANMAVESLAIPLTHPAEVKFNEEADNYTSDDFFGVSKSAKIGHAKIKIATLLPVTWKKKAKQLLLKIKK